VSQDVVNRIRQAEATRAAQAQERKDSPELAHIRARFRESQVPSTQRSPELLDALRGPRQAPEPAHAARAVEPEPAPVELYDREKDTEAQPASRRTSLSVKDALRIARDRRKEESP
jgi:hypothetical protein